MKTGCIYMITNTVNGKQYVGQTWDFRRRKAEHEQAKGQTPIALAFRKYGRAAFQWTILTSGIPVADLDRAEAAAIREHGTLVHRGYNVLTGGSKSPRTHFMRTRQSEGVRRITQDPRWRANNLRQLHQMHASPEWRRKHDAAMARNPLDPEWRRKHAEMVARMCKPVQCVETGALYASTKAAERATGVDASTISKVCRGRRGVAGGFHWTWNRIEVGRA